MSFPVLQKIDSNVSEMVQFPSNVLIKNIQIKIEAITCKSMGEYFDFITIYISIEYIDDAVNLLIFSGFFANYSISIKPSVFYRWHHLSMGDTAADPASQLGSGHFYP